MALAIASAVAVLYTGYVLVLDPVARLRRGLAAVQQGDLSARVEVDTQDEFGELSAGFNEMAQTLQAFYGDLEAKVREKTRSLEVKRQRLADLYEASALMSRAATLEELGSGFARQVRRIAHADAAAVRVCSEDASRFLLLAGDQLPPALAGAETCIQAGSCACGAPELAGGTRIIPIVAGDAGGLSNCREAGFAAVVSVPVRLHERLLGEVDLFYRRPPAAEPGDRELLDALAAHLASAMEGLRAAALEREAAVAQERSMIASELHDSIAQSLAFLKIQVQLLRLATQRGDAEAVADTVSEIDAGVRESYADVRELLVHFRTRTNEQDIEPALRTTLTKFENQTGLAARLELEDHGVPLPPDVQVQLLHIVQEALSNVRKHARARHVVVRAGATPHWHFEVEDDGQGFDALGGDPGETHVGLRIMRERAARIGATVRIDTTPGAGCKVRIELPRETAAGDASTFAASFPQRREPVASAEPA
jgi:two-component system nitrate/nitrite sensor histidine kinase NarX